MGGSLFYWLLLSKKQESEFPVNSEDGEHVLEGTGRAIRLGTHNGDAQEH